jgi:hypothetical protein
MVVFTDSELVLSPSGTARVCPEATLEITCSTDRIFLNWNVTIPPSANELSGQAVTINRLVSSSNQGSTLLIINNNIVFSISIVSNVDPFTSVLSVINVTADLNGAVVQCADIGSSAAESRTSTTFVHVIQTDIGRYIIA